MYAYEFNSVIDERGIIQVPEQYLQNIMLPVKVIILANEEIQGEKHKSFTAMKLKTKGFKFNREEANE